MTGPEHYREAERLAAMCVDRDGDPPPSPAPELDAYLRLAQVHATLAQATATALNDAERGMAPRDKDAWYAAAGTKPRTVCRHCDEDIRPAGEHYEEWTHLSFPDQPHRAERLGGAS